MEFTEGMHAYRFDGIHPLPRLVTIARVTEDKVSLTTGERFWKETGKSDRPRLAVPYIEPVEDEQATQRVKDLFYQKLAEQSPDHPWLKRRKEG